MEKNNLKEKKQYISSNIKCAKGGHMIKKYKRIVAFILVMTIFMTSTGIINMKVEASQSGNLLIWNASNNSTGVIPELSATYPHEKMLYCVIQNAAAYCMNYGKSARSGQGMTGDENMLSGYSDTQQRQLNLVLYFGHKTDHSSAPSDDAKNQYIATQALVWIVEADLLETQFADSAAQRMCSVAPNADASFAYYHLVKNQVLTSYHHTVPSFTDKRESKAQTLTLEWNNSKNRYEKTVTDSNNVLGDFNIDIPGVSQSVSGNKVTFYTSNVINTAKTGTFTSSNGSVEITGNCLYWNVPDPKFQEFVSTVPTGDPVRAYIKVKTEAMGQCHLLKIDQATGVPLKGAVYGIYSDKVCTDLIEKITTDKDGIALSSSMPAGTYYLKELVAPNKYTVSDKIHTVKIDAGKTTIVEAVDKEQLGSITIYKEGETLSNWNGTNFIYENKKLPGATFKLTAAEAIYRADGTKVYSKGDTVKSKLVTGADGSVTATNLHLGSYTVAETKTIDGYTLNTTPKTVTLEYKGQSVEVVSQSTTIKNQRQKASVKAIKQDSKTKVGLPGGQYSLYAGSDIKNYAGTVIVRKDTLLQTISTDGSGNASYTVDIPVGYKYYIKETKAPNLYYRDTNTIYNFTFSGLEETQATAEFKYTFVNDWVTGEVKLKKVDAETGKSIGQGDANIKGAVYGLYAREAIIHPDQKTGQVYAKDTLVAKLTTNDLGEASAKNLFLGKYYLKEISSSEGYELDPTAHNIDLTYKDDLTKEVTITTTSKEQVKKQPFCLIKAANSVGETDADLLEGVGFTAYLKSELKKDSNGEYDFKNATPVIITTDGETEMFTDNRGYAESIPLPYGTYVVIESTIPHNFDPVKPFEVSITEHKPNSPQVWRVLLDKEFAAKLRIIKIDNDTNKPVLKANTEFKIFDIKRNKYVEQITTYPSKVKHKSYFTDNSGTLTLPQAIRPGKYRIEEVTAVDGYAINLQTVEVDIDANTFQEVDEETADIIITAEFPNAPVKGEITIEKRGEVLKDFKDSIIYEETGLEGAVYGLYANQDIYTQDNQVDADGNRTKYYSKDDLVTELITGETGKAMFQNLPLGEYRIEEIEAPEGFVINEEDKIFTLSYEGQEVSIVYATETFVNERQKVSFEIMKLDAETGEPIPGAEFSLHATEDIVNIDGDVIIAADTQVDTAVSGADGKVVFKEDLPFGKYYAIETQTPAGYVSSDERIDFEFSYHGQETIAVKFLAEFLNTPTTFEVTKTDITNGEELDGAMLTVLDKDGIVVDTWTSSKEDPHIIKNLHVGEKYILREEFAPYGYLQASEIEFTVEDTGEVQHVKMEDDVPTGTIIVNKEGELLQSANPVQDGVLQFIFDYIKGDLEGVTFDLYAAEDIVSPDGLNTIICAKDEKITEIVTDSMGIAKIENLPLGQYYLIETKTIKDFVLDPTPIYVDLSYIDQHTAVVYGSPTINNERQEVDIKVVKLDSETDKPLKGAVFGLYAAEDIKNANDEVIVEKDQLARQAVSNKKGVLYFNYKLPLGQYYIKEVTPPTGYVSTDRIYKVDARYQGQEKEVLKFEYTFKNKPTKTEISKTDITGEKELEGAVLSVIDEEGKLIEKWTSGRKPHLIDRLPIGRYVLREEFAPQGYVVANEIEFEVKDSSKVQKVHMKDELSVGKIIVKKTDESNGNPLEDVTFEIRNEQGEVLDTLVTDNKGMAESKELPIGIYNKNGTFKDFIKYYVIEIETRAGYILDSTSREVVFGWESSTERVIEHSIEITNKPTGEKLPQTGELPIWLLFTGVGASLVATGIYVLKKKKSLKDVDKGE